MNNVSPKKLLNSKWTARYPTNKEKHFMVIEVEFDESAKVVHCLMQAVMTKREFSFDWTQLKSSEQWLAGWQ